MKSSFEILTQVINDREISERTLTELREQLFWVILRCREKVTNMCEDAGYTPDEVGLQFLHPTIGQRKSYTMVCLHMD
jgi:hypothetical protein